MISLLRPEVATRTGLSPILCDVHPQQPGPWGPQGQQPWPYQQPPHPGMAPVPFGARPPSGAPLVVLGVVTCVLAVVHVLLGPLLWLPKTTVLMEMLPLASAISVRYSGPIWFVYVVVVLIAAAAVVGGIMLARRRGWARYLILPAAVLLVADAWWGSAYIHYHVGPLIYSFVWAAVVVLTFVPGLTAALRTRTNGGQPVAYPAPQQWQGYQNPPRQRW